jgi:hypothetical protein
MSDLDSLRLTSAAKERTRGPASPVGVPFQELRLLQETAGNAAVSRLLSRFPFGFSIPTGGAEEEAALRLRVSGAPGQSGVGVLYVRNWNALSAQEQTAVRMWMRDMDFQASSGLTRTSVSKAARATANRVAAIGRALLNLAQLPGQVAGHTPDTAASGKPVVPIYPLPKAFNSSVGGQWKRYKPGFTFTGFSLYDYETGSWIYHSQALEHEPGPMARGRPMSLPADVAQPAPTTPASTPSAKGPAPSTAAQEPPPPSVGKSEGKGRMPGPARAAQIAGRASTAATIALGVISIYYGGKIAEEERKALRYGWESTVAPTVDKKLDGLEELWELAPELYPKTKTYIVVLYAIDFTTESHWLLGDTHLYRNTTYLGAYESTSPRNERVFPKPRPAWMEVEFPTHQIFATSWVIADPEGDALRAAEALRRERERHEQRRQLDWRIVGEPGRSEYASPHGGRIPEQ